MSKVLPDELPSEPRCLGMTPAGDGVLVASPSTERDGDGGESSDVQFEFAMAPSIGLDKPREQPMSLGPSTIDAGDIAGYATWRDEYEGKLVALGLVACESLTAVTNGLLTESYVTAATVPHRRGEFQIALTWEDGEFDRQAMIDAEDSDDVAADRVGSISYVKDVSGGPATREYIHWKQLKRPFVEGRERIELAKVYFNSSAPWVMFAITEATAGDTSMVYDFYYIGP